MNITFLNLDLILVFELILVGLLIGIVASMLGIGGGLLTVPTLILLFSRSAQEASAISIVVIIFTSSSASLTNFQHRRIDFRTGLLFAIFVVPFSFLGSYVGEHLDDSMLVIVFGIFLLLVSIWKIWTQLKKMRKNNGINMEIVQSTDSIPETLFRKSLLPQNNERRILVDSDGKEFNYTIKMRKTMLGAIAGGFLGGLLGLGGGVIFVPVLLAGGVPPHIAVATSSFIIIFTSVSGSLGRLLYGSILWGYVFALAIGTVSGARLGAKKVKKISSQKVLIAFYVIVFLSGVRIILKAFGLFV